MKFAALALDYDGTIAANDTLNPEVRAAIDEVRRQGIVVVLVTGRRLRDLRRVAGNLDFLDAVVAENGAVLQLPNIGRHFNLSEPLPSELVQALRSQAIDIAVGECIGEVSARDAPAVVAVIRDLQLPLVLLFNRGQAMILQQGVSKASGLHAALRLLRLSEHNVIAIGDAENDHPMLQACELGAAVAWGSPALKAVADDVVLGDGPAAVATYIRAAAASLRLLPVRQYRRHVALGHTADGRPVGLAVRNRNVLVTGDTQTGKSWVTGLMCEQLILQRYSVCIVDPEGDYRALASLPGVVLLEAEGDGPSLVEITLALRHPDLSLIVDLSAMPPRDKRPFIVKLVSHLNAIRRRTGLPHRIVVDEAHLFLAAPGSASLLDPVLDGYTLVTYRPSLLDPDLDQRRPVVISTRLTDPQDLHAVRLLCGQPDEFDGSRAELMRLPVGQAALLPGAEEACAELHPFDLEPRLTDHVRHRQKYLDVPVPEWEEFAFTWNGRPTGRVARSMRDLVLALRAVDDDVLAGHLWRGDLSQWIRDVFADASLAHDVAVLEAGVRYEALSDLRAAIIRLIEARYLQAASTG